jgi:TetR/AcrR family transcriptional regulator, transcriptional repressor for nem operon
MANQAVKESIIKHGALLVHSRGYNNTGLSDILKAAGVPKGSFYFYFKSKEDFGLALVDYYWEIINNFTRSHISDSGTPPLDRLAGFIDAYQEIFEGMEFSRGCPIGNLMQEMSDLSEDFRVKVSEVYSRMHGNVKDLLSEARDRGDLSPGIDPERVAEFILNSWEGAIMHMKLSKSSEPLSVFKQMVFDRILK